MRVIRALVGILLLALVATPALARQHRGTTAPVQASFVTTLASDTADYSQPRAAHKRMTARSVSGSSHHQERLAINGRNRYQRQQSIVGVDVQAELPSKNVAVAGARPQDCHGIAWCGCYLRHYLGVSDKSLNLAISWAGVGRAASARSGTVVVWRHHVGLMKSDPDASGRAIVLSGNDGGVVRERLRSIRGAVAFREL